MARTNAERQAAMAAKDTETAPTTEQVPATGSTEPAKEAKSIVPKKYAGKYKGGGSDDVASFIKQEAGEGDKFSFDSFFQLCRLNGISEDQINKYSGQIAEERQGAKGRTRMTLGNTLRANARKNGKLIKLDGTEQAVTAPKATLSGAAAAAKETAAAGNTEAAPDATNETPAEEVQETEPTTQSDD